MVYAPWDIVVVPFPFSDTKSEKRRPALIVSSASLISRHGMYWLMMITSAENERWVDDINLDPPEDCGLPTASLLRPCKIATVEEQRILRRLGALPQKYRSKVRRILRQYSV